MEKEGLADMIINTVHFDDIVNFLLQIVQKIMEKKEFESEDRMIIMSGLSIILAITYYDSSRLNNLLEINIDEGNINFEKFIEQGIFCSQAGQIRKYYSRYYYLMCRIAAMNNNQTFIDSVIKNFLNIIPQQNNDNQKRCKAFFLLLNTLIK